MFDGRKTLLQFNYTNHCLQNESTAGADATVEALKLYNYTTMKLLTLAYLVCYVNQALDLY